MDNPKLEDELAKVDKISEARSIQSVEDSAVPASRVNLGLDHVVWATWWLGTILIVLSWFGTVSSTVGWIGFAAALASTFTSVVVRKFWRVPR